MIQSLQTLGRYWLALKKDRIQKILGHARGPDASEKTKPWPEQDSAQRVGNKAGHSPLPIHLRSKLFAY
jgi:hypothetical protein